MIDLQRAAYRYGVFYPQPLYDPIYDVEPELEVNDGDIDIKDLQKFFSRNGMSCFGAS